MKTYKITLCVETAFEGTPSDGPGIMVTGIFHCGTNEQILTDLNERVKLYIASLGFAFLKDPHGKATGFYVWRHFVTAIEEVL